MPELPELLLVSTPAFLFLALIEAISYWLHPADDELGYSVKDTATSLLMWLGSWGFGFFWSILPVFAYSVIYAITPLRVPVVWQTLILLVVVQDLLYYWQHRCHHVVRVLWTSHSVHHSSQRFNFSTALRSPWTAVTYWPFYVPLVALGVHPVAVGFGSSVNLVYQFWLHTERIGKLPRPVEFLFTTPSHHRVHHASQGSYLDRNFGGIFIVWDRMFGSFVEENERPVYGLTKNINTYNPFRVAVHE